jgi:hypothetical protein
MIASAMRKSRNVRKTHHNSVVNNPQPTTPIRVTGASKNGNVLAVTYDQPIALTTDVPKYTTDVIGVAAVSAVRTGVTSIAVTFASSIAEAIELRIPYEDPAVRSTSGGFVETRTFPISS